MPTPFDGYEVEARLRPSAEAYRFDLDQALASMVALEAKVPADAYTAAILGTERVGNGAVISPSGLVVTMAYLITEAEEVVLTRIPFAGYWEYKLDDAIITAPAHPHWSGAALIGPKGDLVGLGSLTLEGRDQNGEARPLNMFVPAELLPPILDDLARGRSPQPPRPWLGVFAQEMENHVVIVGVSPKGPAARAELRPGDLILAIDGKPVSDLSAFYDALWDLGEAGVTVPLKILREGDAFEMEVRSMDRANLLKKRRLN